MEKKNLTSPVLPAEEQKRDQLTQGFGRSKLRRSNSELSFQSGTTEVGDNPDYVMVERDVNFKTLTADVDITVTRWEAFKMFFFGSKCRTVPVEVEVAHVEKKEAKRDRCSRYVVPVHVRSRRKDEDGRWIHEDASCTIDTGNEQGNFVSKEFVLRLGYSEADFRYRELEFGEKEGRSATGHPLRPEGAIRLSWYRRGGPKVFDNMRFLVSSNAPCDLLIGEATITEHNMLPPPMLAIKVGNPHSYHNPIDEKRQALFQKVRKLEAEIDTQQKVVDKCHIPTRKKALEDRLKTKQSELDIARAELKIYDDEEKKKQNGVNTNSNPVSNLNGTGTHSFRGSPPQPYSSEVIATFPDGIRRQATGLTMRAIRK